MAGIFGELGRPRSAQGLGVEWRGRVMGKGKFFVRANIEPPQDGSSRSRTSAALAARRCAYSKTKTSREVPVDVARQAAA